MKVRNNSNGDLSLTFSDGHTIYLGRGEVSRELEEVEISDPYLAKAIQGRRVVIHKDPVVEKKIEPKKEIYSPPVFEPIEKKTIAKKKKAE